MTTVACDGKRMGSDGQISWGDTIVETTHSKVFRLNDGSIIGFSGNTFNFQPVIDYYNTPVKQRKGFPEGQGKSDCMILRPDGSISTIDGMGREYPRTAPCCIGSGANFALAALHAGKTLKAAIKIAIKLDCFSSGKVTILEL